MKKVLVILGPTATGKTDLALDLAKKFNGELVACDSRQVYTGLDIGTGKTPSTDSKLTKHPNYWEIDGVKIWMYDVIDPKYSYTVKDYIEQATKVIQDIFKRQKLPIVVGGTGLYLKALLEGVPNLAIPFDPKLRERLSNLSVSELQDMLRAISITGWDRLNQSDQQNPRRLLRFIELNIMNPYIISDQKSKINDQNYDVLKIGLSAPRSILYEKINSRVLAWLDLGIITEVKRLKKRGVSHQRFKDLGLEYNIISQYLKGEIQYDQMIDQMQTKVRQYAKRQITWFKKTPEVNWFDITDSNSTSEIEKKVQIWYHGQHE